MRPANVSGIVTGARAGQLLAKCFPLSPVTIPEVFAKVNLAQLPSRF